MNPIYVSNSKYEMILFSRLVINLLLINLASCLLLFPAVIADLVASSTEDLDLGVTSGQNLNTSDLGVVDMFEADEKIIDDVIEEESEEEEKADSSKSGRGASLALCVWSTLVSSLVTNGSIMGMMAVGESTC